MKNTLVYIALALLSLLISACNRAEQKANAEQVVAISDDDSDDNANDSSLNQISSNENMKHVASYPNEVLLTGLKSHRIISIYKARLTKESTTQGLLNKFRFSGSKEAYETYSHFMPGIDVLFGYKLLNLAHYDMRSGKQNYFFSKPVLVRSFYYPSVEVDTLNKKAVHRNYYLVSVYDEDTNKDTLITHHDLRHFYLFDSTGTQKTMLLPKNYSVIRSQYDADNDAMFIFARLDANNNGAKEEDEPIHVFWIDLNAPTVAKQMY